MISHRTTARGTLVLALALLTLAGGAGAAVPQKIVFPVLGTVTYADDFGDPRPGGVHQGIDIVAAKRSLALAAEAGKVEFWKTSASAGCMLYLHGASGTDYYYIHLNNDLTAKNDNRGKCVAGTAYAKGLKDGSKVVAGQPVGYVGDSGDANGIHPHLHFELHPGRGKAVDPYPWLQRATHLLFSAPRGTPFTLDLRGTILSVNGEVGGTVRAGETLVVLEAMKMETPLVSPYAAHVQTVHVAEGDRVAGGAVLVELAE